MSCSISAGSCACCGNAFCKVVLHKPARKPTKLSTNKKRFANCEWFQEVEQEISSALQEAQDLIPLKS